MNRQNSTGKKMKWGGRNVLSILLAFLMLVGIVPTAGFEARVAKADDIASGIIPEGDTTNNHYSWSISNNGLLIVDQVGSPNITSFSDGSSSAPWCSHKDDITSAHFQVNDSGNLTDLKGLASGLENLEEIRVKGSFGHIKRDPEEGGWGELLKDCTALKLVDLSELEFTDLVVLPATSENDTWMVTKYDDINNDIFYTVSEGEHPVYTDKDGNTYCIAETTNNFRELDSIINTGNISGKQLVMNNCGTNRAWFGEYPIACKATVANTMDVVITEENGLSIPDGVIYNLSTRTIKIPSERTGDIRLNLSIQFPIRTSDLIVWQAPTFTTSSGLSYSPGTTTYGNIYNVTLTIPETATTGDKITVTSGDMTQDVAVEEYTPAPTPTPGALANYIWPSTFTTDAQKVPANIKSGTYILGWELQNDNKTLVLGAMQGTGGADVTTTAPATYGAKDSRPWKDNIATITAVKINDVHALTSDITDMLGELTALATISTASGYTPGDKTLTLPEIEGRVWADGTVETPSIAAAGKTVTLKYRANTITFKSDSTAVTSLKIKDNVPSKTVKVEISYTPPQGAAAISQSDMIDGIKPGSVSSGNLEVADARWNSSDNEIIIMPKRLGTTAIEVETLGKMKQTLSVEVEESGDKYIINYLPEANSTVKLTQTINVSDTKQFGRTKLFGRDDLDETFKKTNDTGEIVSGWEKTTAPAGRVFELKYDGSGVDICSIDGDYRDKNYAEHHKAYLAYQDLTNLENQAVKEITLVAKWANPTYKYVIKDSETGEEIFDTYYRKGTPVTQSDLMDNVRNELEDNPKYGYNLVRVATAANGTENAEVKADTTGDKVFYAVFEKKKVTLKYVMNNQPSASNKTTPETIADVANAEIGTKISDLDEYTLTMKGYNFLGWKIIASTNGNSSSYSDIISPGTALNGRMIDCAGGTDSKTLTLTAQWSEITYRIIYKYPLAEEWKAEYGFSEDDVYVHNGSDTTYTITDADSFELDNNPYMRGTTFKGWYKDAEFKTPFTGIDMSGTMDSITVYGKFEPRKVSIAFNGNTPAKSPNYVQGNMPKIEVSVGDTIQNKFELKYYDFKGWFYSGKPLCEENEKLSPVVIDKLSRVPAPIVDAGWEEHEYVMTYVGAPKFTAGYVNENPYKIKITDGKTITLKDPLKGGSTFDGWKESSKDKDGKDVTAENSIVVTKTVGDKAVVTGINVAKAVELMDSGGKASITANWTSGKATIKYDSNERGRGTVTGSMPSGTDKDFTNPKDKTKLAKNAWKLQDYTFQGWATTAYAEKAEFKNQALINETMCLYPAESAGSQVVTLYAVWTPVSYKLSYNKAVVGKNGVTSNDPNPDTFTVESFKDGKLMLYEPAAPGYVFGGWYYDKSFKNPLTSTYDSSKPGKAALYALDEAQIRKNGKLKATTVYAKWTPLQITIVYDNGIKTGWTYDGNAVTATDKADSKKTQVVKYGKTKKLLGASLFKVTSPKGWKFMGWSETQPAEFENKNIRTMAASSPITLDNIENWIEKYSASEGSSAGATMKLYAVWQPSPKTITYYDKLGKAGFKKNKTDYENTYNPVWWKYVVNGNLVNRIQDVDGELRENGFSDEVATAIEKDSNDILFIFNSGRTGYDFDGWFTDKKMTKEFTYFETSSKKPVKTLYAKYTPYVFTINYVPGDSGKGTMSPQYVEYGKTVTLRDCTFESVSGDRFLQWKVTYYNWSGSQTTTIYGKRSKITIDSRYNMREDRRIITLEPTWTPR